MNLEQVQRFYNTLALIIGEKEGVDIKVKVSLKEECKTAEQGKQVQQYSQ